MSETGRKTRNGPRSAFMWLIPYMRRLDEAATSAKKRISEIETDIAGVKIKNGCLAAENLRLRGENARLSADAARRNWTAEHIGNCRMQFSPPSLTKEQQDIADSFHQLVYDIADDSARRSYFISWMGYEMYKWPNDLWIYQEIITTSAPDLIIETGTHRGGSALFMATICDIMEHGEIITVDINDAFRDSVPRHPKITYITGSSTDQEVIHKIAALVGSRKNIMVVLDSDHNRDHVLAELRMYSRFVPPGGYLIVEDTNINGHPAYPDFGPGPWEAVETFLSEMSEFYVDRACQRFLLTMHPGGFLRRRDA
jgi:cephalosporin hydroxylase